MCSVDFKRIISLRLACSFLVVGDMQQAHTHLQEDSIRVNRPRRLQTQERLHYS